MLVNVIGLGGILELEIFGVARKETPVSIPCSCASQLIIDAADPISVIRNGIPAATELPPSSLLHNWFRHFYDIFNINISYACPDIISRPNLIGPSRV